MQHISQHGERPHNNTVTNVLREVSASVAGGALASFPDEVFERIYGCTKDRFRTHLDQLQDLVKKAEAHPRAYIKSLHLKLRELQTITMKGREAALEYWRLSRDGKNTRSQDV